MHTLSQTDLLLELNKANIIGSTIPNCSWQQGNCCKNVFAMIVVLLDTMWSSQSKYEGVWLAVSSSGPPSSPGCRHQDHSSSCKAHCTLHT